MTFSEYSPALLGLLGLTAFATGVLHGATGMAGGVVLAAILSHVLGIKVAIPVVTCALIVSHGSRLALNFQDVDWAIVRRVLLFGTPTIVLGATIFSVLSPQVVALIFAVFLILSFPIKMFAKQRSLTTSPGLLAGASVVWGMLAGNVVGPGFFLAPFLLGTGMNRMTFVGSLASITLAMNMIKAVVFERTDLVDPALMMLGLALGVATVPGNWLGRRILRGMTDGDHRYIVDLLTIAMIVNFIYLAFY